MTEGRKKMNAETRWLNATSFAGFMAIIGISANVMATGCIYENDDEEQIDNSARISMTCHEDTPLATDPRMGVAGAMLMEDRGAESEDGELDCLWVGFDDPAVGEGITASANLTGTVVADPYFPYGFYLDPATVSLTALMIPEMHTTVDRVEVFPYGFTPAGGGYQYYDFTSLEMRQISWNP